MSIKNILSHFERNQYQVRTNNNAIEVTDPRVKSMTFANHRRAHKYYFGYQNIILIFDEPNETTMILAELEIHDDHILASIPIDELTKDVEARLIADNWSLATNGYNENGVWHTIYVKHI